jgi:hypothetical protein
MWFVLPSFLADVAEGSHLAFEFGVDGFVFAPTGEFIGFC